MWLSSGPVLSNYAVLYYTAMQAPGGWAIMKIYTANYVLTFLDRAGVEPLLRAMILLAER